MRQIEEVYEKDLAKFTRVRQMLAEKNRQVAFVQRRIEEVPTRTELTQYERRFVELYEQVFTTKLARHVQCWSRHLEPG